MQNLGQESRLKLEQEIKCLTFSDFLPFFEYVVALLNIDWSQNCAYPDYKFVITLLEELDF